MAAASDVPRLVLQAIVATQSPQALPQQRKEAVAFIEQFKRAEAPTVLSVCASLLTTPAAQLAAGAAGGAQPGDVMGVRLAAYQLFTDVVRNRWRELAADQRLAATQLALQQFTEAVSPAAAAADAASGAGASPGGGASPLRGKAAELLAVVVRQQGAAAYGELVPQLMAGAAAGPLQAELTCRVLHYISEDLTQFEVSGPGGAVGDGGDAASPSGGGPGTPDGPDVTSKRAFLSALTTSAPTVFPFLCEILEQHFQAAQQLQSAPGAAAPGAAPAAAQRADAIAAHVAALSAALGALATWVEWVPMRRLGASPVVAACSFFIQQGTSALRMQALDVLRQITWRKRANETVADYTALMDAVGGGLLTATQALGLMLGPNDPLPPAMVRELGYGGSQQEFGARLLEVLEGLGEGHFRCLSEPAGRRSAFLAQLLTFTRHPYLRLSGGTLTLWHQLLREATAAHALTPQLPGGPTSPSKAASSYTLPPELCAELMRVLCAAMARVVPSADPGMNNLPDWCDSHAEYKEVVVSYRSQAKAIIRAAAALAPEQGLAAAANCLGAALTACASAPAANGQSMNAAANRGGAPTATCQLEAAILVVTAVMQPLCDLAAAALGVTMVGGQSAGVGAGGTVAAAAAAATGPHAAAPTGAARAAAAALVNGMAELLQSVLAVRLSDPKHMTLHAEAIEAFGRFLALRPDLAAPTVACCLEAMRLLPLEAPGQLPPPARQNPEWRAQFEARLAMANVLLGLARAAPSSLVPHMTALVTEIQGLWGRGLLREGERVLLWEGLLAASSAGPPQLQAQLITLIFEPIAAQWGSAEWQATVASPQAFVAAYMPLTPLAAGAAGPGPGAAPGAAAGYELGARDRRWTVYHQVTLLERALRRTQPATGGAGAGAPARAPSPPLPSGSGGGGGAGSAPAPEHPFAPHLEWCLPPVARLVACIHALADPRMVPLLGPLALVNEMDALERAVRLGEDRDAVKAAEQPEPRCVAGGSPPDARYFVRGVRECAYMVLSLAATQPGLAGAMWRSQALAQLLPAAVAGGAASLGDHVVRLLTRHVLTPWAQRCPASRADAWMVPLCSTFLPHMHTRLCGEWAALHNPAAASGPSGPAAGASGPGRPSVNGGSGSGGGAAGGSDATTDEVLRDTLLRELSREILGFLNALATRRPADPATDPAAAAAVAVAVGPGGPVASPRASANGASGPLQECLLEAVLRSAPSAAQAGLATGVSALCWPDADSAARAVTFCRSLLLLAQSGHSELEGVVLGEVTRGAIGSLGMVSTVLVQAQVLELLRSLFAVYLAPRHPRAPALRAVLAGLPGVTEQVLDNFSSALFAAHGDKEQRALIKQLLAAVGGEEVRKLLASVSRLPAGVSAVPEPKPRDRGPVSDITPQDMGLPHLFDLPDVL